MLEFFVKRPITTVMFVLFWVVLGIVSYPKMNVERMPPIDLPIVTTTLLYPGAGPSEIEAQVVRPVEDVISKIAGVKKISAMVYENYAFIATEFNLGEDAMEKQQEIKGQVDSILYNLPDDLRQPVVRKLNINQATVMDVALSGADLRKMYDFADDVLTQRISAIPGVASVDIFGGQERAIRVFLDPQRMAAKGVSVSTIMQSITAHNLNVPSGKIESRWSSNTVRFIGEFATVEEIENMAVTTPEGMTFKLKDIAKIEDSAKDPATGGRYKGEEVLIVSIVKATDGNAVKISDVLQKRLDSYNQLAKKELGESARIQIITDAAESVRREVNSTLRGIVFGILLTVATLWVFTKNWRSTIISSVVIPTSLVSGFLLMNNAGFSINTLTLLAIASALGTLISNAIILIESSLLLMDRGVDPEKAAIDGAKKVTVAILAGVGTNIVVFLPLAFMGGIAGLMMNQFGMTVVYLTIMSLMFSFTLTPMMIAKFLRSNKTERETEAAKNSQETLAWYKPLFDSQMRRPWRWVGMTTAILVASTLLLKFVGNEFSPMTDASEININARAPMGATFAQSEKLAKRIEDKLVEFPEISAVVVKIGRRGIQNVGVNVKLIPMEKRMSDKKIAQRIVAALADIPDAEFSVRAGEAMQGGGGGGGGADTVINVTGDNDKERERVADELLERINKIEEVQSALLTAQLPNEEVQFIPDQPRMNEWGAMNAAVGQAMRLAFYGDDTVKFREKGKEYPLLIEFDKTYKTVDTFGDIMVDTRRGMVPLTDLGAIEYRPASRNIFRVNKHRLTEINVNLGKSTIGPVRAKIQDEISKMDMPESVSVVFGGMSEMQDETTKEMANTFILAVILTIVLLAAIMNSIAHPLTISTAIVTSFSGVFILLFLAGGTINVSMLLSVIMLVGLSVNSEILFLDGAVQKVNFGGMEPAKALWEEYQDKWRMVLMTTIAVGSGMLPQLFSSDTSRVSMAAVLIGGTVGGMFFSLMLTPALFILVERLIHKMSKRRQKAQKTEKLPKPKAKN